MTTPAHDPTYLGAAETGWEQGYDAAVAHASGGSVPRNPYTQLRDDRAAYVQNRVNDQFDVQLNEDGEDVFDTNADWIDAILDAHTDWLAAQRAGARLGVDMEIEIGTDTPRVARAVAAEIQRFDPAEVGELLAVMADEIDELRAKPSTPNVAPQLTAGPTVLGWTADWTQTADWRLARHITVDDANGSRHILHVTAGEHR